MQHHTSFKKNQPFPILSYKFTARPGGQDIIFQGSPSISLVILIFQDVVILFVLFASLMSLHVYYSSVAFVFHNHFDLLPCN